MAQKPQRPQRPHALNEDINHYGKIVVALGETIRVMSEIDRAIEEYGSFQFVGSQT